MKVTEVFYSPQGEGQYTGQASAWIRFFGCNLQCDGFGQTDPTDPSTYVLPYKTEISSEIKHISELPVFSHGCDSGYSWSAKYKHLYPDRSAREVCDELLKMLPLGHFNVEEPNDIHLVFTGGEPLLPANQRHVIEILEELKRRGNLPERITFETNGTQRLGIGLLTCLQSCYVDVFMSVSPKLYNVSGEPQSKAIDIEALCSLDGEFIGQFKFVLDNNDASWEELDALVPLLRRNGLQYPIWIMPIGGTLESQKQNTVKEITLKALARGYNVSARMHVYIFGNEVGR